MIGGFGLSAAGWSDGGAGLCLCCIDSDLIRTLEQARSSGISRKARMWRRSSWQRSSRIRRGWVAVAAMEGQCEG